MTFEIGSQVVQKDIFDLVKKITQVVRKATDSHNYLVVVVESTGVFGAYCNEAGVILRSLVGEDLVDNISYSTSWQSKDEILMNSLEEYHNLPKTEQDFIKNMFQSAEHFVDLIPYLQ